MNGSMACSYKVPREPRFDCDVRGGTCRVKVRVRNGRDSILVYEAI